MLLRLRRGTSRSIARKIACRLRCVARLARGIGASPRSGSLEPGFTIKIRCGGLFASFPPQFRLTRWLLSAVDLCDPNQG